MTDQKPQCASNSLYFIFQCLTLLRACVHAFFLSMFSSHSLENNFPFFFYCVEAP